MRHPTGGNATIDWKKVRLLVFGLDDQFRFLARQTFRKLMVADVTTFSEQGDLAGLMARGCDLVLVDLATQPEEGLAIVEALRRPAGNPHDGVPVVAVAPSTLAAILDRAKALGIEGTIPKPVSGHELSHRVAETLASPRRLPAPVVEAPKPRKNAIVAPAPLPDIAAKGEAAPVVRVPGQPVPEVAALAERLAERAAGGKAAAANPPRPDRAGPWSGMVGQDGAAASAVPSAAPPVSPPARASVPSAPSAPARPSGSVGMGGGGATGVAPRPSGGRLDAADLAPAARPTGGKLDMEDLAPARPTGGKLSSDDMARPRPNPDPDPEAEAKRRAAEKRRQQWKEAMEQVGHKARRGGDVAALDLSAVVAEHALWLQTNGAEGKRATFSGMDLAGANLAGAILPNATFKEVDLSDACLAEARLDGSDFRYARLEAADLGGANLGVAALRHAKLGLSNLEGASLRGSDLSGATLSGARMAGADFKGAILIGADLREADLSKVEGLTTAQVEKSVCDLATRLPPGVFRPAKD